MEITHVSRSLSHKRTLPCYSRTVPCGESGWNNNRGPVIFAGGVTHLINQLGVGPQAANLISANLISMMRVTSQRQPPSQLSLVGPPCAEILRWEARLGST